MNKSPLSPELLALLAAVQGKRARIVVDHILQQGFITTEELETAYGYKHPPRAIRDVREQGVPIETFAVKNTQGRSIAAYRFADQSQIQQGRIGGRKSFSKAFKNTLSSSMLVNVLFALRLMRSVIYKLTIVCLTELLVIVTNQISLTIC